MEFQKNLIVWEKYEDLLERQVHSSLAERLLPKQNLGDDDDEYNWKTGDNRKFFAISKSLAYEIQLTTNFDCWIGYTSFNVTEPICDILNEIEGVEALRICSRYRFFIGVGKAFSPSTVKKNIELKLKRYLDGRKSSQS